MNKERMREQLRLHEGVRLVPYTDIEGYQTIGVGYNVAARGWDFLEEVIGRKVGKEPRLTEAEADKVLDADIDRVEKAVKLYLPEYDELGDVRQRVMIDLAFNMGYGALTFRRARAAVQAKNWSAFVKELWNSKWSGQVGDGPGNREDRADRLTKMALTNIDYTT